MMVYSDLVQLLTLSVVLVAIQLLSTSSAAGGKHKLLYDQHDALLVARCDARCWTRKTNKHQCIKQCLVTDLSKPGECPDPGSLSAFDSACLEACRADSQCPGVSKCCRHQCGVTCQPARGLAEAGGLPNIPIDISVSERRRGRTLIVRWQSEDLPQESMSSPTLYVLEERHHAGRHFTESRLGAWTPRHRSAKPSAFLKNLVKPGRWYQFRVAAVNENGTRGWSDNSMKFITSLGPRPPAAPPNMTVGPLRAAADGSLWGELRWDHPSSDLPVQRYKVFWSRRLHGATALNSVLVQHQTVPKDQTKFELKNLQANSLYFLQVQALAQFGKERLKGEKAALVLNTTNHTNVTDSPNSAALTDNSRDKKKHNVSSTKVEGLHIQRVFWSKDKILARIAWKMRKPSTKYTVTWWTGPCQNSSRNISSHLQMAVTTKSTHLDIFNLDFKCRYRVSVREVTSEGLKSFHEAAVTFSTPSCHDLAKKAHKDKPNCSLLAN